MLLFCLIFIYPVSRTAIMSFFSVKSVTSAVSTWSWAGLDNYIKLFHTPLFITSVKNIGKIWLYCGIACLGLAIVLAIILTSGLRGQKFFRAIIYMPNVIAAVAVGYMWLLYVYNAKFGLFHSFFTALGWESMANFQWLGTDHMFLSMCIAYVFSNVGYFMLMYIAAIEKISPDYYEAATIEGANVFDKFFHITLPLIKGVLGTSLVLWTTKTMGFFALAQVFGGVSTYTPMMYTYQTLFGSEISADSMNTGVAAAAACIMTMGNVLIRFDPELFMDRYSLTGEDRKLIRNEVFRSVEWIMLDRGVIDEEIAEQRILPLLPERLHGAARGLIEKWDDPIVPVEGMLELLQALKAKGYRLYLLSNAATRQPIYWARAEASKLMDGVLISAEVKLLKPDPQIYRTFLHKFALRPEECVFIDDTPINVEGALYENMAGIVFNMDVPALAESLRTLGVEW